MKKNNLSPRHAKALQMFIDKFVAGAAEHGDLKKGKKWTKDIIMEMVDANFYLLFQLLDIMEDEDGPKV